MKRQFLTTTQITKILDVVLGEIPNELKKGNEYYKMIETIQNQLRMSRIPVDKLNFLKKALQNAVIKMVEFRDMVESRKTVIITVDSLCDNFNKSFSISN